MGGALAITVRQSDGTENRMERWTNIIPAWFRTLKVQELDDAYLQAFVDSFKEMPGFATQDYGLMPSEYGLIVVDFQTRTILSSNDYTSLNKLDTSGIAIDLTGNFICTDEFMEKIIRMDIDGLSVAVFPDSRLRTFIEFWKAGKILGFELYEKSGPVMNGFPDRSDKVLRREIERLKSERDFYGLSD